MYQMYQVEVIIDGEHDWIAFALADALGTAKHSGKHS